MSKAISSQPCSAGDNWLSHAGAFVLHTTMVYLCALIWFPWLVVRWFAWVDPRLHVSTFESGPDWYLHHVIIVNLALALAVGYGMARGANTNSIWAWSIPALVLGVRMIQFSSHRPMGSVLFASQPGMTAIEYFFRAMPGTPFAGPFSGVEFNRVWVQMKCTAPFCAGVGYSLGALVARYGLLTKMFIFEKHVEVSASDPTESREPGT